MLQQPSHSSLRIDVLTGRQVIVAPGRSRRPGAIRRDPVLSDPPGGNPFLPGNEECTPDEKLALRRTDSRPNESGWLVRVVPNQFPALSSVLPGPAEQKNRLRNTTPSVGCHEVVIESPVPHRRLSELSAAETARVLLAWQYRMRDLEQDPRMKAVTIFRNEGFSAGASLPHVHSQILAQDTIPPQTAARRQRTARHGEHTGNSLLSKLCAEEVVDGRRIISGETECLVMCPFAGRASWQVRLIHRQSAFDSFAKCPQPELIEIAGHLHGAALAIDACVGMPAMNLLLVQPPIANPLDGWFLDLLPRTAGIAGYELLTDVDIVSVAPESSAEKLRLVFRQTVPLQEDVIPPGYRWRR